MAKQNRKLLFHLEGKGIGGNETILASLLPRLIVRGWRTILVMPQGRSAEYLKPHCQDLVPLPERPELWRELLAACKPDVVVGIHGDIFSMAKAARLLGMASVWMYGHPVAGWKEAEFFRAMGATLFDVIIAQSQFLAQDIAPLKENVSVIPNGVDTNRFCYQPMKREAMRALLGVEKDCFLVGFAGRYTRYKRANDVLKAFYCLRQEVPRAALVLLGRSEETRSEEIWRRLWSEVRLLGLTDAVRFFSAEPSAMPDLFCAFDAFVSAAENEGFGCVITEAIASEVPVVVTATGGAEELARKRPEIALVPLGDPHAMAAALSEISFRKEEKRKHAKALRQWIASEYSLERMCDRYEAIFASLTEKLNKQDIHGHFAQRDLAGL